MCIESVKLDGFNECHVVCRMTIDLGKPLAKVVKPLSRIPNVVYVVVEW